MCGTGDAVLRRIQKCTHVWIRSKRHRNWHPSTCAQAFNGTKTWCFVDTLLLIYHCDVLCVSKTSRERRKDANHGLVDTLYPICSFSKYCYFSNLNSWKQFRHHWGDDKNYVNSERLSGKRKRPIMCIFRSMFFCLNFYSFIQYDPKHPSPMALTLTSKNYMAPIS